MINERSLKIVRGHKAQDIPAGVDPEGLTATVALVLSTFRSDSADLVLDQPLWIACMAAV